MRSLSEVSHVVVGYDFVGSDIGYHVVMPGIPLIPRNPGHTMESPYIAELYCGVFLALTRLTTVTF